MVGHLLQHLQSGNLDCEFARAESAVCGQPRQHTFGNVGGHHWPSANYWTGHEAMRFHLRDWPETAIGYFLFALKNLVAIVAQSHKLIEAGRVSIAGKVFQTLEAGP